MNSNAKTQEIPIAFLIKTLPAIIKSKPSLRNPPINGMLLEMVYLTALIDIPSNVALVIPCKVKNIPKTLQLRPIIHLIIEEKKSLNLSSLINLEKQEITPKIVTIFTKGNKTYVKIFIIPLLNSITDGLYTDADTFPPEAIINDIIMGDIIVVNFDMFSIAILVFDHNNIISFMNNKTIVNKHTIETSSAILFEIYLLFEL